MTTAKAILPVWQFGGILFASILSCTIIGCASAEYHRAVKQGDAPWYFIKASSSDPDFELPEISIYKLARKANSEEGKKEGLKTDKNWGEGHAATDWKGHGSIIAYANVIWDEADPKVCIFEVKVVFADQAETTGYSFVSTRQDQCEKTEFENAYLSGQLPNGKDGWLTLHFQPHK